MRSNRSACLKTADGDTSPTARCDSQKHMWLLMKEETDLQGIFSRLVKEYEVDEGILFKDLRDLVDEMAAAGLIVLIPAAQDDGVG